ncbi:hypothetical protein [Aquimarina latercula]|uniref:hypothetical protein n=1 Tax=Aquimarina latercula TaxID=987 RepID=UPI000420B425|nr:hypothetical protein [Aquimarina latercula]
MKKNPFKELETDKEVPEEVKENVMKDIASVKLFMELGDLFFIKYPSVIEDFFKTKNNKS